MLRSSRLLAALALLPAAAACAGRAPGERAPGVGSTSVEWADLRFEWILRPAPDDRLRVRATVTNVGPGAVVREVPRCLNHLRLYRGDDRIWDQGRTGDCFGIRTLHLAAGESRSFRSGWTAAAVLGDSIPAGELTVRVYLPRNDRPGPPRSEMELTLGRTTLRPD